MRGGGLPFASFFWRGSGGGVGASFGQIKLQSLKHPLVASLSYVLLGGGGNLHVSPMFQLPKERKIASRALQTSRTPPAPGPRRPQESQSLSESRWRRGSAGSRAPARTSSPRSAEAPRPPRPGPPAEAGAPKPEVFGPFGSGSN